MQEMSLSQTLHEMRSSHNEDIRALGAQIQELQDKLNQEESDRANADTSLGDRIADVEARV